MKKQEIKKQSFSKGATILLASTIMVKIIGALFKIPLSADYCLGDLGFGYFSSVYDIFTPFSTLAISGFPVAIAKIISDDFAKSNEKKVISDLKAAKRFFSVSSLLLFIIIVCISLISGFVLKKSDSYIIMLTMAPAILFCFIASLYRGYFEGINNMQTPAVSNIIEAFCKLALGFTIAFALVKYTGDLILAASGAMLGITIGTAFSAFYLKIKIKKSDISLKDKNIPHSSSKEILKILIPIVCASLLGGIVVFIDTLTVRWRIDSLMPNNYNFICNLLGLNILPEVSEFSTFLYGIRSKAFTIFNLIPTLTTSIGIAIIPNVSGYLSAKDDVNLQKTIQTGLKIASIITMPVSFGLIFIGTPIMNFLYGDGTSLISGRLLSIYGVAAIFAGLVMLLTSVLQGLSKQSFVLKSFVIGLLIKLLLNIILIGIPEINIYGSALSTVFCYAFIFVSELALLIKSINFKLDFKDTVLKAVFSAVCCGIAAMLICKIGDSSLITMLAIAVAGAVYLGCLLLTKTIKIVKII